MLAGSEGGNELLIVDEIVKRYPNDLVVVALAYIEKRRNDLKKFNEFSV